jgi:transposase InsO family protein
MEIGRYLVEAVVFGGQSPNQLARSHPISRSWLFRLLARYRQGGLAAIEPRSHRPKSCPHQVGSELEAAILELRRELTSAGFDAGPQTILHHLAERFPNLPSRATVWRVLKRHGLVTPQPHKRPKASFTRFEADLPNQLWQGDLTLWNLADGAPVEILNLIDDHSRLLLASDVLPRFKAADVLRSFIAAANAYGLPESLLTDNGAVFTANSRRGKVVLESQLDLFGVQAKHSTPYHPQTCGKVERLHQTLKRFLDKQPPANSVALLQLQLDDFRTYYNQQRPHRALDGKTPLQAFNARIKARPSQPGSTTHYRIRRDRVDADGKVTLRFLSQLRHIHVGRAHSRTSVLLFIAGPYVRICTDDGIVLRELVLDPSRKYQPSTSPKVVASQLRQRSTVS